MSLQTPWNGGQHPPVMRASDADRERAADVLRAGFAEGRLSKGEYDQRLDAVLRAATYGQLQTLVSDLPQGPMPFQPSQAPVVAVPQMARPMVPPTFYPAAPPPTNPTATGALVCGLLTPFTMGLTGLPAVILGHKARTEIQRNPHQSGDGQAIAGLVLGYLSVAGWALLIMLMVIGVAAGS